MTQAKVPTLYDWLGGISKLDELTTRFYEKVLADPLLHEIFAHMEADHPHRVALFLAEVLGGPKTYSEQLGSHAVMLRKHFGKHLTEEQRQRWLHLLLVTADEIQLPDDPEFRSAFIAYLEWGTRLAVVNSRLPKDAQVDESTPMPQWGWGVPGGPYQPPDA